MHAPYQHKKAFDFLCRVQDKFELDRIVCLGDEVDASKLSIKYTAGPDGLSAGEELDEAIKELKPFYKRFPEVFVLESNHTARIFKKAFASGIPRGYLKTYREFLKAPQGWNWLPELCIDGVYYSHGETYNQTSWRTGMDINYESICIGHLHTGGGIVFRKNRKGLFFALNTGCLIDVTQPCFDYARHSKQKPTLGCGVVIDGVGQFIPMLEGGKC